MYVRRCRRLSSSERLSHKIVLCAWRCMRAHRAGKRSRDRRYSRSNDAGRHCNAAETARRTRETPELPNHFRKGGVVGITPWLLDSYRPASRRTAWNAATNGLASPSTYTRTTPSAPESTNNMKSCLKLPTPLPSPTPSGRSTPKKCVAFCEDSDVEVHDADDWDRTPMQPSKKLSYQ